MSWQGQSDGGPRTKGYEQRSGWVLVLQLSTRIGVDVKDTISENIMTTKHGYDRL